eukprot:4237781-Amphidinium_carterae.1
MPRYGAPRRGSDRPKKNMQNGERERERSRWILEVFDAMQAAMSPYDHNDYDGLNKGFSRTQKGSQGLYAWQDSIHPCVRCFMCKRAMTEGLQEASSDRQHPQHRADLMPVE